MTQYGFEGEAFVESEDEQEQQDNLELLQAEPCAERRDDLDEAKGAAGLKGGER